jgi:hypothetical protein
MTAVMEAALAFVIAATLDVAPGDDLAAALSRARAGDVVRLARGEHRASLGRLSGVSVEGAGAGETVVRAPDGADGAVATGDLALSGLTVVAGPERCALKVLSGTARLDDVALAGGACGLFVGPGRVSGSGVDLLGGYYGLLVEDGEVVLDRGSARAVNAGVGLVRGAVTLRRYAVIGPSTEAGVSVAGGTAILDAVVIRAPGPSGIAIAAGGRVEGVGVTVTGATEHQGFLGACVQVNRGELRLEGATLARCAGAAVEASGGKVALAGVDASGGSAGCVVLVNRAEADLAGTLCGGRGPGLVAASGARASARHSRWWTDPALWVDCGSGARVALGPGERVAEPCAAR